MARVFWFRRDLRLQDNVALNQAISGAISDGDKLVTGIYVINKNVFQKLLPIRQASLIESLKSLDCSMDGNLVTRFGNVAKEIVEVAQSVGSATVHATRSFDPDGIAEQNEVGLALKKINVFLQLDDSYYAVAPGSVTKDDGLPYRVYTPFYNNWTKFGWPAPVKLGKGFSWSKAVRSSELPKISGAVPFQIKAGEDFATKTFSAFKKRALENYHEVRNRADLSGTSHLSHALAHGEIHPRTLLSQLEPFDSESDGATVFRKEIAWREFYADVLWHNPHTTTEYYDKKYAQMRYDTGAAAEKKLSAWKSGNTGYPMVDAGMRQLTQTGWMHNRVRMIVASFLVKDLHLEWQLGAKWFEENLTDFDPASNAHGWQWTAGCGTDASPYFRIFNPVLQGLKFDPNGEYVRKYIPELSHLSGAQVHEPWEHAEGYDGGYAERIVDHSIERDESLARLSEIKAQ
jgi:deoxyribodipyrimidine photo-lyase